jgi:hypothetical protein
MDTFDQEIIKTLELLAYKLKGYEMTSKYLDSYKDEPPTLQIYNEDIETLGMNRYGFCAALEYLEQKRCIIIDALTDPTHFDPSTDNFDENNTKNGVIQIPLFNLIVADSIFKVLERYKRGTEPKEIIKIPIFDEDESVLRIGQHEIKIARQDKVTNEHKILKNIFIDHEDNLEDDFYYAEIAKEEFGENKELYTKDKDNWKRYHSACKAINEKVREATDNKIKQFLIFNSTIIGKVRINPEYLRIL